MACPASFRETCAPNSFMSICAPATSSRSETATSLMTTPPLPVSLPDGDDPPLLPHGSQAVARFLLRPFVARNPSASSPADRPSSHLPPYPTSPARESPRTISWERRRPAGTHAAGTV